MKQKQIFILFSILAFTILTITSCKKERPYMNNAEIIGYDARLCPCCGGYEITIDNVPNPNGNSFFRAGQFPSNFNLGIHPIFPIKIKIDWKQDTAHCFGNYISISRIAQ